jgi:large subunit ribosomal protein L6
VSRIGNNPIPLPKGVQATLSGTLIKVKGPKGETALDFLNHVAVKQDNGELQVSRHSDGNQDRAYHGLYQRLLSNMVTGVVTGFSKELELVGVGYRAAMDGKTLVLNLGYSHEIRYAPDADITIQTPKPTTVIVSGVDKQKVGQVAAEIRAFRPPEPYKGKGVKYAGEQIRRKVGKAGAK